MKIPGLKNLVDIMWKGFTVNRLPGQPDTFGRISHSGVSVTEETAFKSVAVWACVRILSETLASLPLFLYRRLDPRGKEKASDHPLYRILHNSPNPEMTSFQLREALMAHVVTWGNAYAFKDIDPETLSIKAIWPLRPDKMTVTRDPQTKEIIYHYPLNKPGIPDIIPAYRIWHIPGLSFDGLVGYSPIHVAREAIGLSLAAEEFGARLFGQGLNFGAVATYPGGLSKESKELFKKDIKEKAEGLGKAFDLIVLENGAKIEKVTIPPNEAQFLETRKFQRGEIASFFHVPPHMIGDLERATFSNIEEQALEFVIYTMRPWLVRWEQSITRSLLMPWEQEEYFAEFQVDGLLRGNIESRYRAYAIARNWGWMSANDILDLENRNGIGEQGDIYMAPANMLPADQFNNSVPKPANQPAKT
jgi:HK97 family phage portal protein